MHVDAMPHTLLFEDWLMKILTLVVAMFGHCFNKSYCEGLQDEKPGMAMAVD